MTSISRFNSCSCLFLLLAVAACGSDGSSPSGGAGMRAGGSAGVPGTAGASGDGGSRLGSGGTSGALGTGGTSFSAGRSGAGGSATGGATDSGGISASGGSAGFSNPASGGALSTSGGTGGNAAGQSGAGSTWRAAIASAVTEQQLSEEYATWKAAHAQSCANGSWVVRKDAGSVVSEGIAYGMLLAVNMADRVLFDGLWKYYADHLDPKGLMNWATGVCDPPGNNNANAATDGDLDAAMALVQAHARWADGGYLAQAGALTAKIIEHETEECAGRATLRPGDMFGGCSDLANQKINPSYFAPAYYRVFAHYFKDQASRWNALTQASYELYPMYQARMGGLVPDWSKYDGSDWYASGYSYDACRTPWRVMVDYAWSGDVRAETFLKNVASWVDGHSLTAPHPNNSAFVGALALASAYDKAKLDSSVAAWLTSNGDDKPYFQGTLRVLYLLAAAGKFPSTM